MAVRAIDCWVNVNMGEQTKPEWLVRVKEDYFRGGDELFKSLTIDETLEMHERFLGKLFNKAERKHLASFQEQRKTGGAGRRK